MLENKFKEPKKIFRVGETVRIMGGPFNHFTGKIEGINKNKALLLVKVEIFGRTTPIKIKFLEAENI
jgi:transcription termination/antitermination protein NusG